MKGFLGGSFDPIHIGHINLALEMKEKLSLEEIIFCPNFISPHKVDKPPVASAKHRLEMVKLAIKGIDSFSVLDFEVKKEKISYTIDTLNYLKTQKTDVSLIMYQDIFKKFLQWKDYKKILKISKLLVGINKNFKPENTKETIAEFVLIRQMDVSSTIIKERFEKNQYIGHLIDQKVLDYIQENNLY